MDAMEVKQKNAGFDRLMKKTKEDNDRDIDKAMPTKGSSSILTLSTKIRLQILKYVLPHTVRHVTC